MMMNCRYMLQMENKSSYLLLEICVCIIIFHILGDIVTCFLLKWELRGKKLFFLCVSYLPKTRVEIFFTDGGLCMFFAEKSYIKIHNFSSNIFLCFSSNKRIFLSTWKRKKEEKKIRIYGGMSELAPF